MILLIAVLAGILVGWAYARWEGKTWLPPNFQTTWLVVLGFLPQFLAFYFSPTRQMFPDWLASISLVVSQLLLLAFAFINRRLPGMIILMIGLGFNLLVILANGGFMPLPVETAHRYVTPTLLSRIEIGNRIGSASKDILLPDKKIVFPWLADRFVSPRFFPSRFAFSLGDIFVAVGAFWLLVKRQPLALQPS